MKIYVYEVVDKLKGIDTLISLLNNNTTNTVELDSDNALELTNYLEEYRDMILNREVIFFNKRRIFYLSQKKKVF